MKRVFKLGSVLFSVLCFIFCLVGCKKNNEIRPIRNVELSYQNIDYQSYFNSFENANLTVDDNIGKFTGSEKISDFDLSEIDNVSNEDIDNNQSIDFEFLFNQETAMVIIKATIKTDEEVLTDELVGYVFEVENGKIDAIITLDDNSTILMSEIESYYLENCGWLSRLIKKAVGKIVGVVIAAVIPCAIPAIVAAVVVIGINLTENCLAVRNYNHNKTLDQPKGIIDNQYKYPNWKMGAKSLSNNGCAAIASYNVMYLLGKEQKLYDVIYYYEATGGTLAFGYFGIDPTSIRPYFNAQAVNCNSYSSVNSLQNDINNMPYSKFIILCYWNDKNNIGSGAHFIAVQKIGPRYYIP